MQCSLRLLIPRWCDPIFPGLTASSAAGLHHLRQVTTAQRATSALQALQHANDSTDARGDAPRNGRVEPAAHEMRPVLEPKDDEDLEPDDYDASSDDGDDAAYCMQPAV